ncbi:MAG: type I toxin-antitoxin system SymE family toxin [Bacteroidales bacterium]|nr:type I toxin-antitoxin system SymE family toxin [Bacteroidales bacterium]
MYSRANVVMALASPIGTLTTGKAHRFFVLKRQNLIIMSNKLKNLVRTFTVQEVSVVDSRPRRVYSELRLRGKWLTDAGFNPRSKVQIRIEQRTLVICPID